MRHFSLVTISPPGYPHSGAFAELAQTVRHGLRELGHEASLATNIFAGHAVNIVFGAHLLDRESARALPPGSVLYNTEQIDTGSPWLRGLLPELLGRHRAWDYSRRNIDALRRLGINDSVRHVPIGHAPQLARIAPAGFEDIDVFFYGTLNPRRRRILEALEARGLNVCVAQNTYGERRDELIARSRLVLNMHYYDSQVFEMVRVSYLLTNGRAVVGEVNPATEIEDDMRQAVAAAPYEALVETCCELAADDARRERLAKRGRRIMAARRESDYLRPALRDMELR
jgi:hypothetical protein